MTSIQTTVFRTQRTQAVELPKSVELPEKLTKVRITAIGNTRVITPLEEAWDMWFDTFDVTADFMAHREQPDEQRREFI